ncbi:MAG: lysophospholipase [Micrococcales bacterium]|nr:lysophospholipase [Actinomycetota bacterium]NCA07583.1 lysophospholipase [Micrococcales bacterium]
MAEPRRNIRIVIIGDDLVGAGGDPKGLGWVGRVIAKTQSDYPRVDFYPLATPEISTAGMSEQWLEEASKRFAADTDNRLIVCLNPNDINSGITMSRSRLNLANILDTAASKGVQCFVVSPIPSRNPQLNYDIEHLAAGFEDVASRRSLPFVDCFRPLIDHAGFNEELKNSVLGLPGQLGHGLIAWLVLNQGWYRWLDLPEQEI